jgi:hypothetical protein
LSFVYLFIFYKERQPSSRVISTTRLNPLRGLHLWPINPLVLRDPYPLMGGSPYLGARFPLRCFQRLSLRHMATRLLPLAGQPADQRCPHPGPLVLGTAPLKAPTPTADRDRPVLRRSEPSSRTPLMGEQTNPWELLHPQDGMSRHRGAEPRRRCGLSGGTSLLSPE